MNRLTVNKQKGFSLVEIAIVLVIIGLLLGGVLKGQEMIRQAKIKSQMQQINGIVSGINTYIDRYGYTSFKSKNSDERWDALINGGFISGFTSGSGDKLNKYGRRLFIFTSGPSLSGIIVCSHLENEIAMEIDRKLDDGKPATGSYRAYKKTTTYAGLSYTSSMCTSIGQ